MARSDHSVPLGIPRQGILISETKQLKVRTDCCFICYQMGQFLFIYKEDFTDIWKKKLIFPVFKAQEFIADERNLSGNTFPREQKMYLAPPPVTSKRTGKGANNNYDFFFSKCSNWWKPFFPSTSKKKPPELPKLKMWWDLGTILFKWRHSYNPFSLQLAITCCLPTGTLQWRSQ